ncbi:MAG: hypothetical protein A2201_12780 [Alicyclobacillus sp. RIFOXYA1_FULL_53_8]|nr:MAG: hypothetical protein A2201_12780 [Alicyclobacillus sp. RIFOXYA1_FULL_53_8]
MSRLWKWMWIAFALAIIVFVVTAVGKQGTPKVSTAPYPGYRVPEVTLQTVTPGQQIKISNFSGKPLFINFWASWCPPCQAETPDLVKAYQQYGSEVQFLGINATAQDTSGNAQAFIKRYGISYPVGFDTSNQAASQFNVNGFPTSIFVNASGVVVARVDGAITPEVLRADLQKSMH